MKINELNLLVVEDDDFQRQMLVKMLHSQGATSIRDAGNGKQALEMIRGTNSSPVHVALCDLRFENAGNGWHGISAASGPGTP